MFAALEFMLRLRYIMAPDYVFFKAVGICMDINIVGKGR